MKRTDKIFEIERFSVFQLAFLVFVSWILCGCSNEQYVQPGEVSYEELSACYSRIMPRVTSSLDVLEMFDKPGYKLEPGSTELFSQGDTTAASLGQSKGGYKTWFTMVAFNKQNMTAERKYFYLADEDAGPLLNRLWGFLTSPAKGLIFDGQVILPAEVIQRPYMTQDAKQIAILKQVAEDLRKDTDELGKVPANEPGRGNQKLAVSSMFINQVFKTILLKLEESPALARSLEDEGGVQFDHISFGKGRVWMTVEGSIATVKISLGYFKDKFETAESSR
jgi:hypothetical protein